MPELGGSLRELIDRATPPVTVDVVVARGRSRRRRRHTTIATALVAACALAIGGVSVAWPRANDSVHAGRSGGHADPNAVPAGYPQPRVFDSALLPGYRLWFAHPVPDGERGGSPDITWYATYLRFGLGRATVRDSIDIQLAPGSGKTAPLPGFGTLRVPIGDTFGTLQANPTPGQASVLMWPIAPGQVASVTAPLDRDGITALANGIQLAPGGRALVVGAVPSGFELVSQGPGMRTPGVGWRVAYTTPPGNLRSVDMFVVHSDERAIAMLQAPGARAVDIDGHPGVLLAPPAAGHFEVTWDLDATTKVVIEVGPLGPLPPESGISADTMLALARSVHTVPMSDWRRLEQQGAALNSAAR